MRVLWSFAIYLLTLTPTCLFFFFFNDTATTEIYTLSLHDALPISFGDARQPGLERAERLQDAPPDSDETQPGQKHTEHEPERGVATHFGGGRFHGSHALQEIVPREPAHDQQLLARPGVEGIHERDAARRVGPAASLYELGRSNYVARQLRQRSVDARRFCPERRRHGRGLGRGRRGGSARGERTNRAA